MQACVCLHMSEKYQNNILDDQVIEMVRDLFLKFHLERLEPFRNLYSFEGIKQQVEPQSRHGASREGLLQ